MGQWVRVVVLAAAHNSRLHRPFDHLPDPVLAGWAAGDSADHDPAASRQCPWQPQPGDRPLRMKGRRWRASEVNEGVVFKPGCLSAQACLVGLLWPPGHLLTLLV